MVFYVESAFQKTWYVTDMNESEFTSLEAKWVFKFANDETASISNSNFTWNGTELDMSFVVPEDFFTPSRAGPCTYQVIIFDSDDNPVYYSQEYFDQVRHPVIKKSVA